MDVSRVPGAAQAAPQAAPVARSSEPISATGDQSWKEMTEQANRAYARDDFPRARTLYLEALSEAQALFDAALVGRSTLPVPVILNISCHNLAELEEKQGNRETSESYFRLAFDRLIETARSPASPLPLRLASAQHLKHALAVLVQHYRKVGKPDHEVSADISRAKETAFSVLHVARHAEIADASCAHCKIASS